MGLRIPSEPIASQMSQLNGVSVAPPVNSPLICEYFPPDGNPDYMIVAVTGIHDIGRQAWTSEKTKVNWLQDLLPKELPKVTIWSHSQHAAPDEMAITLMEELCKIRREAKLNDCPLLLIGHGAGGTACKQLYIMSNPFRTTRQEWISIHQAIKSFAFFDTIQQGEHTPAARLFYNPFATVAPTVISKLTTSNRVATDYFNQYQRINIDFIQVQGEQNCSIVCFYEDPMYLPTYVSLFPPGTMTLEKYWISNIPLKGGHSTIIKYDSETDQNYEIVAQAIKKLGENALKRKMEEKREFPTSSGEAISSNGQRKRLLSLDGGGIRGIFAVVVLQAIMEKVKSIEGHQKTPSPWQYFDLIGGTSTGGLLAIMLGRLQMDLDSCGNAYRDLAKQVFNPGWLPIQLKRGIYMALNWPQFSGEALENAVKKVVKEKISQLENNLLTKNQIEPEDAPMKDLISSQAVRTFVCATVKGHNRVARLRTYDSPLFAPEQPCKIWQASRATSAAPTYFPSIKFNDTEYWDGGLIANNPISEVVHEARCEWGLDTEFQVIISIGTGKPPILNPGDALQTLSFALNQMGNAEQAHLSFEAANNALYPRYFRLNGETDLCAIDLADYTKVGMVEKLANDFVRSEKGSADIQRAAYLLARNPVQGQAVTGVNRASR